MWKMTEGAPPGWQPRSKMTAGVLGILLNGLGIHSFYLGNSKKGVIQLVVSVVTCGLGGIWGLIEGIQILTGSIDTDAYGIPLTQ
jgi:TM2 domain-containing membrane protein YozV